MNSSVIRPALAASALLLASPLAFAAGPNCAAMEADGPQWFAAQLDTVQATYKDGNSKEAYQQLRQAMMGLPRSADVSLDARCVGPAEWQRMYQLRQQIAAALGMQAEKAGKLASTEGALDWYVRGDNRADARRVITQLTPTAEGTAYIVNRLRTEIALLDRAQESGFEPLPDERSARAFWQTEYDETIAYATQQTAKILDEEAKLLTRAATSKEEQLELMQENQQTLLAGYLGDESLAVKNEAQRDVNRAEGSLSMLVAARDWSAAVSADAVAPVNDRAVMRGDALLAQADQANLGLEARDSLYEAAEKYFKFAGNSARQETTAQSRARIAPALKEERDERAARTREKAAELQQSVEQAKDSMQKTDAQKQSFKDEADALEDELGF